MRFLIFLQRQLQAAPFARPLDFLLIFSPNWVKALVYAWR